MRMDEDMEEILRDLPGSGSRCFHICEASVPGDRATEFKQRCTGLGIKGVSLHSYRYAWAERAKTAGYPERYARGKSWAQQPSHDTGVFAQSPGGNAVTQ